MLNISYNLILVIVIDTYVKSVGWPVPYNADYHTDTRSKINKWVPI